MPQNSVLFFFEKLEQNKNTKVMNWHAHCWDNSCEHLVIFTSSVFLIKDKTLQS